MSQGESALGGHALRWTMHVDMDAFYAAIEQRDHPQYRGRPLVVGALPGHRGVVATCSYEARQFGIHSAMPISEAYRRCPHAIYVRPRMGHYAQVSERVMAVLQDLSPLVEPVSIDEAFLDISGLERLVGSPHQIGERAKQGIVAETGLTASVGIGPNRLIAKLASDHGKPNGLTIVGHDQVQGFLDPMPVSNLRGVGRRTLPRLERLGIRSVAELRRCSSEQLEEHFGRQAALSLFRQARGEASDRVITDRQRKSISKETTFGQDVADGKLLHDVLRGLSEEVGRIARREHLQGRVVNLKIRFAGFETYSRQHRLDAATNSDRRIFAEAWRLYLHGKLPMKPVRLIGVGLSEWASEEGLQLDLFGQPDGARREQRLLEAMDRVAERFGRGKLQLGLPRKH